MQHQEDEVQGGEDDGVADRGPGDGGGGCEVPRGLELHHEGAQGGQAGADHEHGRYV